MDTTTRRAIDWIEQGYVPDSVIRAGIRRMCSRRLGEIRHDDAEAGAWLAEQFVAAMDAAPVAILTDAANEQHYEVPAEFFRLVLGGHRKYSCALWNGDTSDLDLAEAAALEATAAHAGLADGQRILELGCGWGSLTLWMARAWPATRITAVSNSASQRMFIETQLRDSGLSNVEVLTADMNSFAAPGRYDRVVSVEMFEHMRNWRALFGRVHDWLVPGGRFLMHVFCHRSTPYAFEEHGPSDWMSRHFFSGGMMPSDDLPLRFQDDLRFMARWRWDGTHYERTANAWLRNLDTHRQAVMPILERTYGTEHAALWLQRWRIFFMACAELFGYDNGQQWWVNHSLFERPAR